MTAGLSSTALVLAAALTQGHPDHAHHAAPVVTAEGGWVKYQHETGGFSFEYPGDWQVVSSRSAVAIHIAHPSKPAHLFIALFTMQEGSLEAFAEQRFGVQPEIFKPSGPAHPMSGVGWSGLVQEADAAQEGQRARRRILCAKHESLYVSLALYVDPAELAEHDKDYERLFSSLRFGK